MASKKKKWRLTRSLKRGGPVYQGELPDLENVIIMDRYGPIDEGLRQSVNQPATRPSWADAWEHSTRGRRLKDPLDAQASPEERLAVFQQIKASGDLPQAAGFYLVADQADFLIDCNLADRKAEDDRRIEASLGEDAPLYEGQPWEEACALHKKQPAEWDRLYLGLLLKSGEVEMARLYVRDRKQFRALLRKGERFFYPKARRT
jgi:hypothetical protein